MRGCLEPWGISWLAYVWGDSQHFHSETRKPFMSPHARSSETHLCLGRDSFGHIMLVLPVFFLSDWGNFFSSQILSPFGSEPDLIPSCLDQTRCCGLPLTLSQGHTRIQIWLTGREWRRSLLEIIDKIRVLILWNPPGGRSLVIGSQHLPVRLPPSRSISTDYD